MSIFFTSDTHFNHTKILSICRPMFSSIEEMNEKIISNWNEVIGRGDTVYHLGDFGWKDSEPIIRKLHGQKILILGSHDSEVKRLKKYFSQITPMKEINPYGQAIILSHCSMRVWEKSHYGSWHLFGHSHGTLAPFGKSFDVGVDAHDFMPWSWDEVAVKMMEMQENVNPFIYNPNFKWDEVPKDERYDSRPLAVIKG
jgi:calcineurin-like phosphoesterase family protein